MLVEINQPFVLVCDLVRLATGSGHLRTMGRDDQRAGRETVYKRRDDVIRALEMSVEGFEVAQGNFIVASCAAPVPRQAQPMSMWVWATMQAMT